MQKSDGDYEAALKSLSQGIGLFEIPQFRASFSEDTDPENTPLLGAFRFGTTLAPWIQNFTLQEAVDCFEALRVGGRITDPKTLVEIITRLAQVSGESWLTNRPPVEATLGWSGFTTGFWPRDRRLDKVEDAAGNSWDPSMDFWKHALWWVESQLQPSEFLELLNKHDDEAAGQCLRSYFFGDELWAGLPERAKSNLISADRGWFSGTSARTEAILNELRIAVEELLLHGLWKPLQQRISDGDGNRREGQTYPDLLAIVPNQGQTPNLLALEKICRTPATLDFLMSRHSSSEERRWFHEELPKSLWRLRRARNRAEHESTSRLQVQELKGYISEFLGLGQPGVLLRLAKILFS